MHRKVIVLIFWQVSYISITCQSPFTGVLDEKEDTTTVQLMQFYSDSKSIEITKYPEKKSIKKFAPKPKTQFGASCTGWATATARSILENIERNILDPTLIEKTAFSPIFQYKLNATDDNDCDSGAYTGQVVKSLKESGAIPNSLFHENDDCPGMTEIQYYIDKATQFKISDINRLWAKDSDDDQKINEIKRCLTNGLPLVVTIKNPESFYNLKEPVWLPTEHADSIKNKHAICVVGYNDEFENGVFEIQNSWGTNWGNKGYAFIKYQDFLTYVTQVFVLSDKKETLIDSIHLSIKPITKDKEYKFKCEKKYKLPFYLAQDSIKDFQITIRSNNPHVVYLLGTQSAGDSTKLVLDNEYYYTFQEDLLLPNSGLYYRKNSDSDEDYLVVILSKNKIKVENSCTLDGANPDKLIQVIDRKLKKNFESSSHVTYTENEIRLVNEDSNKPIIFVLKM